MTLSSFIRGHYEEIISAFEEFAATLMPAGPNQVPAQLRDHAQEILTAVVADMESSQTRSEESDKSMGRGAVHAMAASGQLHADARVQHGFTPRQVLAEFRALRASVLRLYEQTGEADAGGMRRFNESIDEALTESITRYTLQTDVYRDQFIGILGHDLRDPLNAIVTGATLLTIDADTDRTSADVASQILRSAKRMSRLTDDLLNLTLLRLGGAIPLTRVQTDLKQLCQEAVAEAQAAHPAAEVKFTSSGELSGEWDRERLAQVLANLVGNALQHGDGDAATLQVRGGTDDVVVTVHNRGVPIPPELQRAIFDPLFRNAPDATASSSIGLGLFIAQAIVTAHGGEISVSSSESLGTTFTVRLPRRAPRPVTQ
jgi:signal transduction histidine kinase